MASAWGSSWSTAWANAWGVITSARIGGDDAPGRKASDYTEILKAKIRKKQEKLLEKNEEAWQKRKRKFDNDLNNTLKEVYAVINGDVEVQEVIEQHIIEKEEEKKTFIPGYQLNWKELKYNDLLKLFEVFQAALLKQHSDYLIEQENETLLLLLET